MICFLSNRVFVFGDLSFGLGGASLLILRCSSGCLSWARAWLERPALTGAIGAGRCYEPCSALIRARTLAFKKWKAAPLSFKAV